MHSQKKRKKLTSSTHQTEHVKIVPEAVFYQEMKWGTEDRIKHPFYTMQRINPL
ncbi:unnamed protein product, partial [Staurois parvus]